VTTNAADAPAAEPQAVLASLTGAAIFLVAVISPGASSEDTVRDLIADLPGLTRAVGFRDLEGYLTCVTGLGAAAWDRLAGGPRPAGLHPFREIRAGARHAVATPGDLLFHIRAARTDLCFELASQIMARLSGAVTVADEVHGFRYFDERDLLGFVDGTENPVGAAAAAATLIGAEDPAFAAGSYVIVQKYLHDRTSSGGRSSRTSSLMTRPSRRMRTTRSPRSRTPTARKSRSSGTICRSALPAAASSAPTSSATPAPRTPSS
jgi:putative iron-dependent peroxidase